MRWFQPCLVPHEAPLDKTWVQAVPQGEVWPPLLPALPAPLCSQNKEGHICVGTSVLMKLSQQQHACIDIKGGLLAWFYGWAFMYKSLLSQIKSMPSGFFTSSSSLSPALAMCPPQSWYLFHICRVPLLKHWNLVPFKMLQGIAWLCRYNRKFKEAQCLHRGANGIEIDTLRVIKWHQTLTFRHLHATLISTDSNGCLCTFVHM